jgi:hypothetical protein
VGRHWSLNEGKNAFLTIMQCNPQVVGFLPGYKPVSRMPPTGRLFRQNEELPFRGLSSAFNYFWSVAKLHYSAPPRDFSLPARNVAET